MNRTGSGKSHDEQIAATSQDALEEVRIYLSWVPPNHADAAFRALGTVETEIERLRAKLAEYDKYVGEFTRHA